MRKLKNAMKRIVLIIILIANGGYTSGLRYWGAFGGGIGTRDFDELTYTYSDLSVNLSYVNIYFQSGFSITDPTGGVCAPSYPPQCWDHPNKFFVKNLIGYLAANKHIGFSIQSGSVLMMEHGHDGKNRWEIGLPANVMFLVKLFDKIGMETGFTVSAMGGDYFWDLKVKLIFGYLPFVNTKQGI